MPTDVKQLNSLHGWVMRDDKLVASCNSSEGGSLVKQLLAAGFAPYANGDGRTADGKRYTDDSWRRADLIVGISSFGNDKLEVWMQLGQ